MRGSIIVLACLFLASAVVEAKPKKRVSHAEETQEARPRRGQSIGAPWQGKLEKPSRFKGTERTFIRRTNRVYGTRTTIDHTRRAIAETLKDHPKAHKLAIGDFSAEDGGAISGHASHRSGRDVDLGLFYKKQPKGYPENFVSATPDELDKPAMWRLIIALATTAKKDGGVQVMFLDYKLQGAMYKWAQNNGVPEKRLKELFQYGHGKGVAAGLIRHHPNHDDHIHVRFKCADADSRCR